MTVALVLLAIVLVTPAVVLLQGDREHWFHDSFWVLMILLLPCVGVILFALYEGEQEPAVAAA